MIHLENVGHQFESGFAISDLNLTIQAGEKINIFGPNGAGKTTFLRILACLITPEVGSMAIMGHPPAARIKILRSLGYAPQSGHFYESLTVRQNLEFYGKMYELDKLHLEQRIDFLLSEFNLTTKIDIKVAQLSKGMKQRLQICKALLHDPRLLLLDEPYSGLDLESAEYLQAFIDSLADKTVITATHDFESGVRAEQRIIIFNQGKIAFDGQWPGSAVSFKDFYREKVGQ